MALSFDLEKIQNYKTRCYEEGRGMAPVTEALIWATMSIGIGDITDKNHQEFYERLEMHQKVYGPLLRKDQEPFPVTLDMVRDHIGLQTNVYPKVSKKKFTSNLAKAALEKVLRG